MTLALGLAVVVMMRAMMDLLAGRRYRVASYGVAAAYAGWLLRQYGAEVDHTTALDPEGIGAFLGEGASFDATPALTGAPDALLITDAPVNHEKRDAIAKLARDGQVLWITPWGHESAWSERPWSDLTMHAAGGWMSALGEPGREPLGPPGAQGQFVAGLYAAIAAVGLVPGRADDRGIIDVSIAEAVVATMIYDPVAFQYHGTIRQKAGNRFAPTQPTLATLACKDGHIGLHCALHGQWVALCSLIGHPELVHDTRFASPLDRAANVAELDEYLLPWLAERTRWEAYHELQRHRIPCSPLPDMAEVLASPQLEARGAWHDVSTPGGRQLRVPGPPARVLASPEPGSREPSRGPWQPGKLRVVDLSMGWAGPMVGYILAALGADVIKVESHTHFDWWRGSRPPGDDPSLALIERSHVFNTTNRGKRGVCLNLATPRGKELALQLMDHADVVVENYGAGVMEKLGLGYDVISARNPLAQMVRLPGFGSTGPEGMYLSFGNTIEGMSGLSSVLGYEDGPPSMMSNALGDPVAGLNGTLAALAAVRAHERDGRGRLVECSQLEAFLPLVGESLIEYQATGVVPPRRGNRREGSSVAGAFGCAGEEWVAIEAGDAGLARLLGGPPAADPAAVVGAWAALETRDEVLAACFEAGIAASPVNNEAEVLGLDPLAETGFWQGQERAVVGFHQYPGLPVLWDGRRAEPERPAPTLGEHTDEILAALGLSLTELELLAADGVIGTVPPG
ncbi:MAG: CoA transferase [Dehalococcoidia bacterium]